MTAQEIFNDYLQNGLSKDQMLAAVAKLSESGLMAPSRVAALKALVGDYNPEPGLDDILFGETTPEQQEALVFRKECETAFISVPARRRTTADSQAAMASRAPQTPEEIAADAESIECECEAYWTQYPQEQAMITLRDDIRRLNNAGDWRAELAHDAQGYYVVCSEIAGEEEEYPVRSMQEFVLLCEFLMEQNAGR